MEEEKDLLKNKEAEVNADAIADKNQKLLETKVIVDADEHDAKKMDDKIKKAEKAMKVEEKEIKQESVAEKTLDLEKKKERIEVKKEAVKKVSYKTLKDKDVEIRSGNLPHETAGNY